jgi:hypothetical protein
MHIIGDQVFARAEFGLTGEQVAESVIVALGS